MFKPVSSRVDFPTLERELLQWWLANDLMKKYIARNENARKRFSFLDGPITANNPMGVHHAWGRTYKDLFQRFKTMQGFAQRYQNGFDGQGLWVEVEVEKELGFNSKRDIENYGLARFVEQCRARVEKFSRIQTEQSIRLGYWMDWDNSYYTTSDENNYAIWHFLQKCHEQGLLYKGHSVMPWCTRCGTALSQHELATEGYEEITHPSVYVRLRLKGRGNEYLLVWTTTPWTLTSNVAVAVHPELLYAKVKQGEDIYYLSQGTLDCLSGPYTILGKISGRELLGLQYEGPFDYLPVQQGIVHKVIPWEQVGEEEGTGLVHIAPGCGQEDFELSREHNLAVIAPLDEAGYYGAGFDWLTGRNVQGVNQDIFADLSRRGVAYKITTYTHRYPVCWRCKEELVFRLVDEWFIKMDDLRHKIMDVTRKIRWIPDFALDRELDWLRNMGDWCISRKRYWGLALPFFECACGHLQVIGSKEELYAKAVSGLENLKSPHRPYIDAVKIPCPNCGQLIARIPEVGDAWLDAGIVPFSTLSYFEDKEYWQTWFPADFITESFPGQFRCWFYSLLTMSTVLEGANPFKTCLGYALVRDEQGEEMHKSKGNAIWFDEAAERMGVDAMRWIYLTQNPVNNLNFGYGVADEVRKRFLLPLWNAYSFFVTYANIDRFNPMEHATPINERSPLDRWILAKLNILIQTVTEGLNDYDTATPARAIESFVDDLSTWYIRRSRRRYWKSEQDKDKTAAYTTLYEVLVTLSKLIAPFIPFLAEHIYQNLVRSIDKIAPESVHLADFPQADAKLIDKTLLQSVDLARRIVSLGRAARNKAAIKVRQPLSEALINVPDMTERTIIAQLASQILEELNVKRLAFAVDMADVITFSVRPRLDLLGPKYGQALPAILRELTKLDQMELARQVRGQETVIVGTYTLEPSDLEVIITDRKPYAVATDDSYAVAIDTRLTPELLQEGLARELIHRLQLMRKQANFNIEDRIITYYQGSARIRATIETHAAYIKQETLSLSLENSPPPDGAYSETLLIDGEQVTLAVTRPGK
ncbi:MAG: isoleucine--tRNA ligase [Chloroflexi bacterium]|nr:isoleucine--tRNA ligase [Chloroflexota bacterium]MCL5074412.1 isoleucine--tRNA ligase [Chloroflexota bacterium]